MIRRLIACLLIVAVLSSCGVVKVKKPPEPAPKGPLKAMKFESGNAGDAPAGWTVRSYRPGESPASEDRSAEYKVEYTDKDKRSGDMSLLLRPLGKGEDAKDKMNEAGFCGRHPHPGSPVRISAYVKADPGGVVHFGANHGIESQLSIVRHQWKGPGWAKVDLIHTPTPPAVGPDASRTTWYMCLFLGLIGASRAWLDDVSFTKVDLATLSPEKVQPVPLENLDMERFNRAGDLDNWVLSPSLDTDELLPGFELKADRKVKRSGAASLLLTTDEVLERQSGNFADYCLDPQTLVGKKVRLSGWVKTDLGEQSQALIGVNVSTVPREEFQVWKPETFPDRLEGSGSFFNFQESLDWTRPEVVTTVPKLAKSVCISVSLGSAGSVWADDLSLEVIDL